MTTLDELTRILAQLHIAANVKVTVLPNFVKYNLLGDEHDMTTLRSMLDGPPRLKFLVENKHLSANPMILFTLGGGGNSTVDGVGVHYNTSSHPGATEVENARAIAHEFVHHLWVFGRNHPWTVGMPRQTDPGELRTASDEKVPRTFATKMENELKITVPPNFILP